MDVDYDKFTEKHQIYPRELSDQEIEEHFEYEKKIKKNHEK
jgi:hypothetical protein